MRRNLLGSIAVAGVLLTLAGSHQRAVAKEPTIDDRFRDAGNNAAGNKASEAELPLLNPQQSRLTHENPDAVNFSGPAYLGVTFTDSERKAVVRSVAPGSPAEQAGLQPMDVIETLQGISIGSPQEILDLIAKMRPGTMLDIGVSRRVNVRAQAPLSILPGATTRSVGYPPESAGAVHEHDLLPVPANAKTYGSTTGQQSNRKPTTQSQNGSASGQYRNDNKKSGQPDDNRRLGLGRRR